MIDPVLAGFAQSDNGLLVPSSLAKRRVIPYDDLSADGIPVKYAAITPDLISTLAILAAQGPTVARMLRGDDAGRLRVDADLNVTALIGRSQAISDTQLLLPDATFFGPGDVFVVVPQGTASVHGPYQIKKANPAQPGLFDLFSGYSTAVAVGDSARRFPLFGLSALDNSVVTEETRIPWNATTGTVVSPNTPNVGISEPAGLVMVVTWVHGYIRNSAATAYDGEVKVDMTGFPTQFHSDLLLPATAFAIDRVHANGLTIEAGNGFTVTLSLSAALGAGQQSALNMGGYLKQL